MSFCRFFWKIWHARRHISTETGKTDTGMNNSINSWGTMVEQSGNTWKPALIVLRMESKMRRLAPHDTNVEIDFWMLLFVRGAA